MLYKGAAQGVLAYFLKRTVLASSAITDLIAHNAVISERDCAQSFCTLKGFIWLQVCKEGICLINCGVFRLPKVKHCTLIRLLSLESTYAHSSLRCSHMGFIQLHARYKNKAKERLTFSKTKCAYRTNEKRGKTF